MKRIAPGYGTRFAARAMLFVWLVSLATGWVNACVLPTAAGSPARSDLHHARAVTAEAGADHGADHGANHRPQPGLAACRSFCDVASDGVVQAKLQDCEHAPLARTAPRPVPAAGDGPTDVARWLAATATPPPEPSRFLLFLRLTI